MPGLFIDFFYFIFKVGTPANFPGISLTQIKKVTCWVLNNELGHFSVFRITLHTSYSNLKSSKLYIFFFRFVFYYTLFLFSPFSLYRIIPPFFQLPTLTLSFEPWTPSPSTAVFRRFNLLRPLQVPICVN